MRSSALLGAALAAAVWAGAQALPPSVLKPPGMSYEAEVPPVPGAPAQPTLALRRIAGVAHDNTGNPVPELSLGLFGDTPAHPLIAVTATGPEGKFDFGDRVPAGHYRLVAEYPGLCTANIPITLDKKAHGGRIDLEMDYPGLDVCSSARVK